MSDWNVMSSSLVELLDLETGPIALTFVGADRSGIPAFDRPMSEPTADGRSGRVPASCVFWMEATDHAFTTVGEDHGNCSVGRWVHGFATLDDIAAASDVAALFESGWVTTEDVGKVHVIQERPEGIVYGPLGESTTDPDVVVLRLNPRQMMQLSDAVPELELSGKPQCQIISKAKAGGAAVSMGCALSRQRTGMRDDELTCAIAADSMPSIVERLESVVGADAAVREYAVNDRSRFDTG
jgi:uncharacterized protein (DUF169 family)